MSWMRRFHEDHMSLLQYLPKFEGNLKDIEFNLAGRDVRWELKEFTDLIKNVVRPHFEAEEKGSYREFAALAGDFEKFIEEMLDDHKKLYGAFDRFIEAVDKFERDEIVEYGKIIVNLLKVHIEKEEKVVMAALKKEAEQKKE